MATCCLRLIEYRTEDGSVFHLKVAPDVAEALKGEGARLKEVTFTDLGDGQFELTEEHARRRPPTRDGRKRAPWAGPRFTFSLILGEHRPGWMGARSKDKHGKCGLCHGRKLPPYAYCLGCDRCGRELEIPGSGMGPVKPQSTAKFKPRARTKRGRAAG